MIRRPACHTFGWGHYARRSKPVYVFQPRRSPSGLAHVPAGILGYGGFWGHVCSLQHRLNKKFGSALKTSLQCALMRSTACDAEAQRLQHSAPDVQQSRVTAAPTPLWRVAIVGRPNVGKSTLYNRIVTANRSGLRGKSFQLAIVGSEPGTTRDCKETVCSCGALSLLVTDTVGLGAEYASQDSPLQRQVNGHMTVKPRALMVARIIESSDVVLFVVDAKEGITPIDEFLARHLLELVEVRPQDDSRTNEVNREELFVDAAKEGGRPSVILVVNKAEGSAAAECLADVYALELGHPLFISSRTSQGLDVLYDRIQSAVKEQQERLRTLLVPLEHHEESVSGGECEPSAGLSREAPPMQAPETEAWLEGLARRYGRGVHPALAHMQRTADYSHLPWSLKKASLEVEMDEEPGQAHQNKISKHLANRELQTGNTREQGGSGVSTEEADMSGVEEGGETSGGRSMRDKPDEQEIRVTFIGRPNAGKSSLINSILNENRLHTCEKAGTTTDSIRIPFRFKKQQMVLIDTAGVTRGWKMRGDDLLQQASMQTMRNIRGSDVCILCLDAAHIQETGHISSNDLSLANLATEKEGRCLLVCVTKWDMVAPNKQAYVRRLVLERMQTGLGHLKLCPVVFTSAVLSQNLPTLLNKAVLVYKQWCSHVSTADLNAWLQQYTTYWPSPWRLGSQCQVKYITQAHTRPPTFVAWSNVYAHFPIHYRRQLINAIRDEFGMNGIPVRLVLRTTAMPKPGRKLSKADVLKWKRLGPHQVG